MRSGLHVTGGRHARLRGVGDTQTTRRASARGEHSTKTVPMRRLVVDNEDLGVENCEVGTAPCLLNLGPGRTVNWIPASADHLKVEAGNYSVAYPSVEPPNGDINSVIPSSTSSSDDGGREERKLRAV